MSRASFTCLGIRGKSQQSEIIALPHSFARRSFVAHDQAVASGIPAAHDMLCKFRFPRAQPTSGYARFLLRFPHLNKGGTAVDLALRLNVLAVCTVFAFVGAILLGAF
jgi:hypothetical protein